MASNSLKQAKEFNLGTIKKGNSLTEKNFVITTVHGNLTKVELITSYQRFRDTTEGITITSDGDDAGITITNASSGEWKINSQIIDWAVGTYSYYITFTFSSGFVQTYLYGTLIVV